MFFSQMQGPCEENWPSLSDDLGPEAALAFVVQHQQAACAGLLGDQYIEAAIAVEVGDIQAVDPGQIRRAFDTVFDPQLARIGGLLEMRQAGRLHFALLQPPVPAPRRSADRSSTA